MQKPRKPSQLVKLPKLTANAIRPTGPKAINIKKTVVGGYGDPPPGFIGGQNSLTEWIVYWALAKIFKDPVDPRKPPFYGGEKWSYQVPKGGKFRRALGSAVVDFVVYYGQTAVAIRIQTEFFHLFTASRKQASDLMQRVNLTREDISVIDVYDYELLGDPTGAKAIVTMKRAIGLLERPNPLIAGGAIRASRQKVLR